MDKISDTIRNDDSICEGCANKHGAKWPEGHVASHWEGTCSVCEKEGRCCCAASDYSWPEAVRHHPFAVYRDGDVGTSLLQTFATMEEAEQFKAACMAKEDERWRKANERAPIPREAFDYYSARRIRA